VTKGKGDGRVADNKEGEEIVKAAKGRGIMLLGVHIVVGPRMMTPPNNNKTENDTKNEETTCFDLKKEGKGDKDDKDNTVKTRRSL
jgi:hypothetical protein